jgi:hypothetical protein
VGFGDRPYRKLERPNPMTDGTWFYDAVQRSLYVKVSAKAGGDSIVNLKF